MAEISATASDPASCLAGGGAMGRLMRAKDWARTPLGALPSWPQSLRTAVSICLNSRFAIILWWGAELAVLYNDDYAPFLGVKHPDMLGKAGRDCWSEIWAIVGPMLHSVMTTGQATRSDDLLLLLERHGYAEECYFTFSYSPIRDESGGIGGVFTPVAETTEKVIGERRLTTLRDLASRSAPARSPVEACHAAIETLSANPHDVPFALLYLREPDGKAARLAGRAGIAADTAASPAGIDLAPGACGGWPVAEVFAGGAVQVVDGLAGRFGALPAGAWDTPPHTALVLPLMIPAEAAPAAVLVAAVSPRKALDPGHRSFFDLVAAQVATALANAAGFEQERRRERTLRLAAEAEEEKLRRLNQTLEGRVRDEMTERRRTEAALFQAHKLEAVGALTGGIAHDFNNLLTSVIGSVDLIAGARDTPERSRRLARAALRSAERGARLTQQLLAFARRQDLRPENAHLGKLLKEMQELLRRAAGGLVELAVVVPGTLWECAVDTAQFEATVLNLVVNARDAMPGGGKVSLALANQRRTDGGDVELPPGDYVEMTVRDTGHGMAPEVLARALEPFFTTKDVGKGTGLGLSMVYGFARQSGGTVRIDSARGAGTTVHLDLPRVTGGKTGAEATGRPAVEARRGRGSVLLVEDDEDVRQVTVDVLRELGYRATVVGDAPAALQVIRSDEPLDLLLSDIMMASGMSGRELAREAQRLRPELKVLLISGYNENSREAPQPGDFPFLGKPFRAADLGRTLAGLLGETV